MFLGFPCGSAGKESAHNEGDLSSIPGLGRSPGEGKGYPLQYPSLENSMDYIVHVVAKSQTQLSNFHFHFPCFWMEDLDWKEEKSCNLVLKYKHFKTLFSLCYSQANLLCQLSTWISVLLLLAKTEGMDEGEVFIQLCTALAGSFGFAFDWISKDPMVKTSES